jgi:hypothetical protein
MRVGTVVATVEDPATPYAFRFASPAGEETVGIGSLVRVEGDAGRRIYAVVTDGVRYRGPGPGDASGETVLWTASVLRQLPAEPLRPVPVAEVFLASPEDVRIALRMDGYAGGVPVGLYGSGGSRAAVRLDFDFLLGPEAAHLNVSGISGLATKTSAMLLLLQGVFRHFPPAKGTVAAVCFNVKGADLCFLDRPAALSDEERAMYAALGLEPKPFERVRYYAPFRPDGVQLNTLRTHPELAGEVQPLVWGLPEVLEYAEVLLSREDIDAKADAFLDFLADRVVGREFRDDWGGVHRVNTFADLEVLFRAIFDGLERSGGRTDLWRTHHVATIRKVRNRLLNVSVRCKGLVSDDGGASDLPFGAFEDRTVYVLDVANTDALVQDLVFTRVVSKLRERLERRDLGVNHVIVLVDELNQYAAADAEDSYVRRMLLDIAERGRYLGLVLFGAQQFRSQVHRRVVGNAGTAIVGRSDPEELATPGYHGLSAATRVKLATLPKGEVMVRHPHFTQPIFVRFPRPAALLGTEGLAQFPPAPEVPFEEAVVRQLASLDRRVAAGSVREAIAGRDPEDVRRALAATRRARPANVLEYFRMRLGPRVPRESRDEAAPAIKPLRSMEDPYAAG